MLIWRALAQTFRYGDRLHHRQCPPPLALRLPSGHQHDHAGYRHGNLFALYIRTAAGTLLEIQGEAKGLEEINDDL